MHSCIQKYYLHKKEDKKKRKQNKLQINSQSKLPFGANVKNISKERVSYLLHKVII